MPTTQITEFTGSIDTVAARTDSAGAAVSPDWKAEERRMAYSLFSEGIATPANGWQVVAGAAATMNLIVGSGAAEVDLAIIVGDVAGQGSYLVRLDEVTKTVTLDAAGASLRQDNLYLVVYDHAYDATSRTLPRLVVRKGDAGGADPGPDAAWKAFLLLVTVSVPAGAADITECTITDQRIFAESLLPVQNLIQEVDGSVEVSSVTLTGSAADVASVVLAIPAHWRSWNCYAEATYWIQRLTGNPFQYQTRLRIDGVDQQLKQLALGSTAENQADDGAIAARRTGLVTTGNRTISLRAFRPTGTGSIEDIFLYARATRTS